jgi:hypothetical protein
MSTARSACGTSAARAPSGRGGQSVREHSSKPAGRPHASCRRAEPGSGVCATLFIRHDAPCSQVTATKVQVNDCTASRGTKRTGGRSVAGAIFGFLLDQRPGP